jgi:hypothetical protein
MDAITHSLQSLRGKRMNDYDFFNSSTEFKSVETMLGYSAMLLAKIHLEFSSQFDDEEWEVLDDTWHKGSLVDFCMRVKNKNTKYIFNFRVSKDAEDIYAVDDLRKDARGNNAFIKRFERKYCKEARVVYAVETQLFMTQRSKYFESVNKAKVEYSAMKSRCIG